LAKRNGKVILTGTSSGLGKYLLTKYPNSGVLKTLSYANDINQYINKNIDIIVHSSFDSNIKVVNYKNYLNTNIYYTESLVRKLKPKKFIYISSVNVYSKTQSNTKLPKL
jgi:nucleoside-diphosphate-sugar epimerase